MLVKRLGHAAWVATSYLAALSLSCSSNSDCSLNGVCSSSKCTCDHGWKGTDCGILDLYPASRKAGYNHTADNEATWGNQIVQDPTNSSLYHLFFAEMKDNCDLYSWIPYSRIMRAESSGGPEGPYGTPVEVVPTFAHNPTVVWSPADKLYLMYHIGCPISVKAGCGSSSGSCSDGGSDLAISLRTSTDLKTWKLVGRVLNGGKSSAWDALRTNPSGWPLLTDATDKTMLLAYRGKDSAKNERIGMSVSTAGYKGPYTEVGSTPLFTNLAEDPFLWKDKRGNFHLLMHAFTDGGGGTAGVKQVGRHAYATSYKGPWTYNNNSLAYDAQVSFTDGTSINYGRRERPHLYFSTDGNMTPLYLTSGVKENPTNWSYSIIEPIGKKSSL